MKDLFSRQAAEYAKYRPHYPPELYNYIYQYTKQFDCAWDCATGNGQAAEELSKKFKLVMATDASEAQIRYAIKKPNIIYDVCEAEKTPFKDQSFDLVTVAQALHWFDFDRFYAELFRVLKSNGVFAAWSYDLVQINPEIDRIIGRFYNEILAPYWDPRRKFIDEKYETIPFPMKKIETPQFSMELMWSLEHLLNYISKTWSAVQTYVQKNGSNPIDLIKDDLEESWGQASHERKVIWPIYLLLGMK